MKTIHIRVKRNRNRDSRAKARGAVGAVRSTKAIVPKAKKPPKYREIFTDLP
jgi:hypothetical protein